MTDTDHLADLDGRYLVVLDGQGQHSLWRDFIAVPAGWTVTYGPAGRQDCLDHIDVTWADPRPAHTRVHATTAEARPPFITWVDPAGQPPW